MYRWGTFLFFPDMNCGRKKTERKNISSDIVQRSLCDCMERFVSEYITARHFMLLDFITIYVYKEHMYISQLNIH